MLFLRPDVGQRDLSASHDRSGGIGHCAINRTVGTLAVKGKRYGQNQDHSERQRLQLGRRHFHPQIRISSATQAAIVGKALVKNAGNTV
jgi:hypothetical protein